MSQSIQKHTNEMPNGQNNQFDNHSPSVTSVMRSELPKPKSMNAL